MLGRNECKHTCADKKLQLNVLSIDNYRKIVKEMDHRKVSYHTFQLKQERAFRTVIKDCILQHRYLKYGKPYKILIVLFVILSTTKKLL